MKINLKEKLKQLKGEVESKVEDLRNSDIYENGLQVMDAYKDARDSFTRMYAEDYYDYKTSKNYADENSISMSINNNSVSIIDVFYFKDYETIDELTTILNNIFDSLCSFSKIKLFKIIIDPVDSKEKVFKIGEFDGLEDSRRFLTITCNDEYRARIVRTIIQKYGYTYQKNDSNKLIKRIMNTIKD